MKPVFQALVALICIAAVAALIASYSLDGIVKSQIESSTSRMLETTVTVDDVSVSILDGSGTIEGFRIRNPENFEDGDAMNIGRIRLKLDPYSLLSDTVVVKNLVIEQPHVFLKQKANGDNNLEMLASRFSDSDSESEKFMVIDHVLIEEGEITFSSNITEKEEREIVLPKIELTDVGRDESNTIDQAIGKLLKPVIRKAIQQAIKENVLDQLKNEIQDFFNN